MFSCHLSVNMLSAFLFIWILGVTVFFTLFMSLVFLIESGIRLNTPIPYYAIKLWAKYCLLFHSIEIIGKEYILKDQPQIIYSNHQGNMDILLATHGLDIYFSWLAKASLFRIPIFGWLIKKMGFIPVYREDPKKAFEAVSEGINKLKENTNVYIFPEGTWSSNPGELLPFKQGLYALAIKSQAPILPITLLGSYEVNPPDTLKLYPGKLKMIIHPPIYPEDYINQDKDVFLDSMKRLIERTIC